MTEAHRQLEKAGYLLFLTGVDCSVESCVRAKADLRIVTVLRGDRRFKEGIGHLLHVDVGTHRLDFRGHRNEFGKGSLQIVIDKKTGVFYSDVDAFSPYSDLIGLFGHAAEVIRNRWRRWF